MAFPPGFISSAGMLGLSPSSQLPVLESWAKAWHVEDSRHFWEHSANVLNCIRNKSFHKVK